MVSLVSQKPSLAYVISCIRCICVSIYRHVRCLNIFMTSLNKGGRASNQRTNHITAHHALSLPRMNVSSSKLFELWICKLRKGNAGILCKFGLRTWTIIFFAFWGEIRFSPSSVKLVRVADIEKYRKINEWPCFYCHYMEAEIAAARQAMVIFSPTASR